MLVWIEITELLHMSDIDLWCCALLAGWRSSFVDRIKNGDVAFLHILEK